MAYTLKGRLLEVCNCNVLCPCWIGEDPDNGTCNTIVAWHFDEGNVGGVDVSGTTIACVAFIPGNILEGNWRAAIYVSDNSTSEQEEALLNVYTGKLGGPVADLVQLIGEVVSVERAPITFEVNEGKGKMQIGDKASAEMEPFMGPTGKHTTLSETVFSTVPGAPVFVGKALSYKSKNADLGIDTDLTGHNALQSVFQFEAA